MTFTLFLCFLVMAALEFDDRAQKIMKDKGKDFEQQVYAIGELYEKWYAAKPDWIEKHGDESVCEFLKSLTLKYKPNTLWTKTTYLKNYLELKYRIPLDSSHYRVTQEFLKRNHQDYEPEKARTFEIYGEKGLMNYWVKPEKSNLELLFAVMSVSAVFGASRGLEISSLLVSDVVIVSEQKYVEFSMTRVKTQKRTQSHIIPSTPTFDPTTLFLDYHARALSKAQPNDRFFVHVHPKTKEFYASPCGKNYWTNCAREIAKWLGYAPEMVEQFSSHSFRSTCATAMAENGASVEQIMVHGNWESEKVMQGYVRSTKRFRTETASLVIQQPENQAKKEETEPRHTKKEEVEPQSEGGFSIFGPGCTFHNASIVVKVTKE